MAVAISAFDISTRRVGVCAGSSAEVPTADAWLFPQVGRDHGALGAAFWRALDMHRERFPSDVWAFEAPIMTRTDRLDVVRKIYGLEFLLEAYARRWRIEPVEVDLRTIKRELGGHAGADKEAMIAGALKCGIALPETQAAGRDDAADAFGAWLVAVRTYDKTASAAWDRRLWSARGAML